MSKDVSAIVPLCLSDSLAGYKTLPSPALADTTTAPVPTEAATARPGGTPHVSWSSHRVFLPSQHGNFLGPVAVHFGVSLLQLLEIRGAFLNLCAPAASSSPFHLFPWLCHVRFIPWSLAATAEAYSPPAFFFFLREKESLKSPISWFTFQMPVKPDQRQDLGAPCVSAVGGRDPGS